MSNLSPADRKVRMLARLPGNSTCPNCGLDKKFGFSNICVKFGIFVCDKCKSSHQAISHRCKSLTMSCWEISEVDLLERMGNDHTRSTWLATAPPFGTGGRPHPDDDMSVFKSFVVNAYERRLYYRESSVNVEQRNSLMSNEPILMPEMSSTPSADASFFIPPASNTSKTGPSSISSSIANKTDHSSANAALLPADPLTATVADFLDFASIPVPSPVIAESSSVRDFGDVDFGAFQLTTSPSLGFDFDALNSSNSFSEWENLNSSCIPPLPSSSIDLLALETSPPPPSSSASESKTFDDYDLCACAFTSTTSAAPLIHSHIHQKPIMRNGSPASSAISNLDFMMANHSVRSQPLYQQQNPAVMMVGTHQMNSGAASMSIGVYSDGMAVMNGNRLSNGKNLSNGIRSHGLFMTNGNKPIDRSSDKFADLCKF